MLAGASSFGAKNGEEIPVMESTLLEVQNLEVTYGRRVRGVQGVSLNVAPGSIVALVGNNGAGKTTTVSAAGGFLSDDEVEITAGRIFFDSVDCTSYRPYHMCRAGLALVPESTNVFERLTVEENLVAGTPRWAEKAATVEGRPRISSEFLFDSNPVLSRRARTAAGYLSGGERQMLAIAMALRSAPKLVIIDEMSLGLSPVFVQETSNLIRLVNEEFSLAFLIVEQNAGAVVSLADHIYVLENGRVAFEGSPAEAQVSTDFRTAYLGLSESGSRSYRDVKQYRRKRRWFG